MEVQKRPSDFGNLITKGDYLKVTNFLEEKGYVNSATQKPYCYGFVRKYMLKKVGRLNDVIEQGLLEFYQQRQNRTAEIIKITNGTDISNHTQASNA